MENLCSKCELFHIYYTKTPAINYIYSVPLISQVHCCPVEELLSSALLRSILESLVYNLEAGIFLAMSSLLGYLGFYEVFQILVNEHTILYKA